MKTFFAITLFVIYGIQNFAQVNVGNYIYANDEIHLEMDVTENGMIISSATVVDLSTNQIETGSGYYTTYPGYEIYKIQTKEHIYLFDIPTENLKLKQYSIAEESELKTFKLKRESFIGWNGTYMNSKGGLLIIGNYREGIGFDYRLICENESDCGVLNLAGMTKLLSEKHAYEGIHTAYPDVRFELKGQTVLCLPSSEMLGNCRDFTFDYEFVRNE